MPATAVGGYVTDADHEHARQRKERREAGCRRTRSRSESRRVTLGAGAGIIHNTDTFTSTDNTVRLPAFTRVDGAVFVNLTRALAAQVNMENVFDAGYYAFSHNNNNITPGSPRAFRVSLTTRF
jgi:outer membrane receptor for ferric coprogen and ferric-rhodotorulic acid